MDYSLEPNISSKQEQASKAIKGKVRLAEGSRSRKYQDTQRVDIKFGEFKRNAGVVPGIQPTVEHPKLGSRSHIKKDDELVKHMSNLPGYLQQLERGENCQGKVLNFGVLDWKRLEKWKSNEGLIPARHYMSASSSKSDSSFMAGGASTTSRAAPQSKSFAQGKHRPSNGQHPKSAHDEILRGRSQGKVTKLQGFETAPWSNVDGKQKLHVKDNFSEIYLDKEKRKELDNRNKSTKELPSLNRRKNVLPTSSHVTKSGQDIETNTMVEEEIGVSRQPCGHESIVLLLPKSSPNQSGPKSIHLSQSRTSVDENSGMSHSNLGCFSPEEELNYINLYAEVPHSCPLLHSVVPDFDSNEKLCTPVNSLNVELGFDASGMHQRPKEVPTISSYCEGLELNSSRLDSSSEIPQRLDQNISVKPVIPSSNPRRVINPIFKEGPSVPQSSFSYATVESGPVGSGACAGFDISGGENISASKKAMSRISTANKTDSPRRLREDICEQPATIGRYPSPSRHFTFSKMTRSLSFKDNTSLSPIRSSSTKVKSGPLTFDAFRGLDEFNRHNASARNSALLRPSTNTETPRRLDQHLAVKPDSLGWHLSPKRFSFSRMSRSFSSKDGSSVPRLSFSCATKSKPVGSEASDALDMLNRGNSTRFSHSATAEIPRILDQNIDGQPDNVGRHFSPSRRFSFRSLPKISRSLDFKEVFSGPQLSSYATVKSRPAGLNSSAGMDEFNQDNVSASNRARISPLRRLLEPLLKPRGVVNSAETAKSSKENLTSESVKPLSASGLRQNQKHETPNVQALLQLTKKNGLPLFKLVVDGGSDILAAAVKHLPAPGDDASSLIYALYSVHEIKNKNGGWMSQGSRGKQSSFGYNIIGHMKVSDSCSPVYSGDNMKNQYVIKDSVLYGLDIERGNKQTSEFKQSKELAAIAIKNPCQKLNDGDLCSREVLAEPFLENTCNGREIEDSNSTTVVLGGVHGLPDKVIPSPSLIWKYGGSCDCGGWDVSCKLQILTSQDQKRSSRSSCSCSSSLDLFFEGNHQEKRPSFRLYPFKTGVYSVEFNPSISLVQSFFISIAFLSSRKLHESLEEALVANNLTEPKLDPMKFPTTIQGDIPAKYVTKPPSSPVGRV